MRTHVRVKCLGACALLVAALVAASPAEATRGRVALLDIVGVGGAAVFGPTYRHRTWSGTPYFQFYQPRFYTNYPLPRTIIRAPQWNSTRW